MAFDPIMILACWALQNDRQNLSFVKATNVVGEKMAGNTCKMAISYLCHFRFETEFSIYITYLYKTACYFNATIRLVIIKLP